MTTDLVALTIEIYSLAVLETQSPKARCQQGQAPSEILKGGPFLAPSSWFQVVRESNSWVWILFFSLPITDLEAELEDG